VQARAARMEVERATEHNGPSIWAVRPIAVRAKSATMDDLRVTAGRGDPTARERTLRTTDQYELDLTDGDAPRRFACLRSGEARAVVTREDWGYAA
jgi:hypothetical protein